MRLVDRKLSVAAVYSRKRWLRLLSVGAKRFAVIVALFVVIIGVVFVWLNNSSKAGVSRYGFYTNANSLTPGSLIGTVNTPTELDRANDNFRLLMGIDAAGIDTTTTTLTTVSVKGERTCGLTPDQRVYCWGSSFANVPVAIDYSGVLSGKTILSVSNGDWHTCVIASDNQLYCWGQNTNGQLGNNSTSYSSTPVAVDTSGVLAGKTIVSVSTGINHTCVIASDNQAYCWGQNNRGQLGNNASVNSLVPVAVDTSGALSGKNIQQISSGFYHTCAVDTLGQSYCWGSNTTGQLGNNSFTQSLVPVATYMAGVLSGKTILSISAHGEGDSGHACVIASDNLGYCWGHNGSGRLGNGSTTNSSVPVAVSTAGVLAGKTLLKINTGLRHTCAVASDNKAYCWGYNTYGQTASGQGTVPGAVNTSGVLAGKNIVDIGGGARHTCALDTAGQTYCWGYGAYGNMGVGNTSSSAVPVTVNPIVYIPESIDEFTLQYAEKTGSTCSEQTDGYSSVTNSTPIAYNTNPGVPDRTNMTGVPGGLVVSGGVVPQQYVSSNTTSFTNIKRIPSTDTGVWDFSLKDNGSAMGTTYCLRIAYNDGTPLASYTTFPEVMIADNNNDTPYRVFDSSSSITPGNPLAPANLPAQLTNTRDTFRLRAGVGIGAGANITSYKLQYAQLTSPTCSTQNSGFSNVTGTTPIAYIGTAGVADRTAINAIGSDPLVSDENSPQVFVSSGDTAFTNPNDIPVGMTGLWDFSLIDNTTFPESAMTYCLRIAHSNGSALGFSTAVAQVKTAERSVLGDSSFRFYSNADSVAPGAALASIDERATLSSRNDAFRLRAGFGIELDGFKFVASGEYYTCGINTEDQVSCWGDNGNGQLGNNSMDDSLVPNAVDTSGVLAGKTIKSLVSNDFHTCVIASDNLAYCWGANWDGQLGINSLTDALVPAAVDTSGALAGKTIKVLTGADYHTCAIASDDQAYCWGANYYGELGDNSTNRSLVPVAVNTSGALAGKTVTSISAGEAHTCALTSEGFVYCWGDNGYGQLGNNSTTDSTVPIAVNTSGALAGKTVTSISAGGYYNCAITSDGQLYCWGRNNQGQLGNNSTANSLVPVAVDTSGVLAGKTVTSVSNHRWGTHACAVTSENRAYCWGDNLYGQLGNNSTTDSLVPVAVDISGALQGKTISQMSVGSFHGCVVDTDSKAYCWGANLYGQLGDNSITNSSVAVAVSSKPYRINPSAYTYKLQFAARTAATCSLQNSGFADVTGSTSIAYNSNAHVSDRIAISTTAQDPTVSTSTVAQQYISSSSAFTTSNATPAGKIALFDFSLKDNGSPFDTEYCLRVAYGDGSTFGIKTKFPSITTASARYNKPTVGGVVTSGGSPIAYGIFDSNYAGQFRVRIGSTGKWYVLGDSYELTASGDNWYLNLSGLAGTLSPGTYNVYAEAVTVDGVTLADSTTNELSVDAASMLSNTGTNPRAFIVLALCGVVFGVSVLLTLRMKSKRDRKPLAR